MIRLRYVRRLWQILSVISRHGFGWLVVRLGLGGLVPFHWGIWGHPRRKQRYSAPEHLRLAFEELGTTFIKLAQILSTRPDLVSPAYAEELARLQDRVSPLPFDRIRPVLEEELGRPYAEVFTEFDPEPIASASIGQVYRAALAGGTRVVVKVQKPGVARRVEEDLVILRELARQASLRTELGRRHDVRGVLEEFAFSLTNELDYSREAQNAGRFRSYFPDDPRIQIPAVHGRWTTRKLLVMEEVRGVKVTELDRAEFSSAIDRHKLAVSAVEVLFQQIFELGFFHADPHPGNFVVTADHRLAVMDFGMVGHLSEQDRESFFSFSYALARGDAEEMVDSLGDLGVAGPLTSRPTLKRDLSHLYHRFQSGSMAELAAADLLRELMRIAFRHELRFPADLALLLKVLAMSESLGALIDPRFKLLEFALPYMKDLSRKLFSLRRLTRGMKADAFDLLRLSRGLPRRLSRLLRQAEAGGDQNHARQEDLEREGKKIYRALNRIRSGIFLILLAILFGIYTLLADRLGPLPALNKVSTGILVVLGLVAAGIIFDLWKRP